MKPKRLVKVKQKSISKLKKEADLKFSNFIRERDGFTCITCGSKGSKANMQCGHYIPRSCLPLRFDIRNAHCQCVQCNIFKKGNYTIYAIKMMEKYGDNILYELNEIARNSKVDIGKYGRDFYEKIINLYS